MREDKPAWAAVPRPVKARTDEILGAHVTRAVRAYGGYGPSATFVLTLDDGRRAFFKGVYPLPEGSAVRWMLDEEARVYEEIHHFVAPWAPAIYGSLRIDGWHALLIEAVDGERLPPWSASQAERAARSYARFHATTMGRSLPEWLPREHHLEFAGYWRSILTDIDARDRLGAACRDAQSGLQALGWVEAHGEALASWEERLAAVPQSRFALLHFDTRSDNVRLDGELLRIFDWPFACVGPPEFDLGAFAQSITGEGGPAPEQVTAWYSAELPLNDDVLTASIVGIAGYFADRAPRPDLPGLPRLRQVQRRQLKGCLAWAARRLELPLPDWLASVAD